MKQINMFKNITAALLMVAGMTACSQDNKLNNEIQESKGEKTVTQTIQITFDGNNGTRAIDADGHKSVKVGESVCVLYNHVSGNQYAKYTSVNIYAYDEATKTASLNLTLTDPEENTQVAIIYPWHLFVNNGSNYCTLDEESVMKNSIINNTFGKGLGFSQDGTLEGEYGANRFDYCKSEFTLDGTSMPSSISMTNQLSICKFTIQDASDNSDITSTINNFTINDGAHTYYICREATAGPIYVVLQPVSDKTFTLTAQAGLKVYKKTVPSVTLQAGKIYNSTLKLPQYDSKIGKVLGANGNIYATVAEAEAAGTTASGMIAYEGEDTGVDGKTHGLCISLHDGNAEKVAYPNISFAGFPERPDGSSEWAVPATLQWQRIFNACGGSAPNYENYSSGSSTSFDCGAIQTLITACGGDAFHADSNEDRYFTSFYHRTYKDDYGVYVFSVSKFYESSYDNWYRGVFAW